MGTMNNKNYICVRHHVKNICNLEIDQAMELNIELYSISFSLPFNIKIFII